MPFHYVLAELLAKVPGALAVVFTDDSGETIDVATTSYSPEELKILGAYFGIGLRQAREILDDTSLGDPRFIHIRHKDVHIHSVSLPDDYFLVLLQSAPASTAVARRRMRAAVEDLERELFT